MADDLYERYKNALRAGHVAVLRGRLSDALASYREAGAIAPDRALPHTSLGGVLLRLGHVDEALFEYDAALARARRDEAVLLGRAEALVVAGRSAEAAASLDRAAEIQEASGRVPEAADTVRRAIELESTPERLSRYRDVLALLQPPEGAAPDREGAARDLSRALRPLEADEAVTAGVDVAEPSGLPGSEPAVDSGAPSEAVDVQPLEDLASLEAEVDRGEAEAAPADPDRLVALARVRGRAGLPDAALDAVHLALGRSPGDPRLHLALVELYAARGWRDLAVEKLALLDRLAALTDDAATREAVARAAAAFAGDARLSGLLA